MDTVYKVCMHCITPIFYFYYFCFSVSSASPYILLS